MCGQTLNGLVRIVLLVWIVECDHTKIYSFMRNDRSESLYPKLHCVTFPARYYRSTLVYKNSYSLIESLSLLSSFSLICLIANKILRSSNKDGTEPAPVGSKKSNIIICLPIQYRAMRKNGGYLPRDAYIPTA